MKRCSVITFGCKVNQYESQALHERLRDRGYTLVDPGESADLFVINTCTVTETAVAEAERLVRKLHRKNPVADITITGCAADSHKPLFEGMPGVRRVVVHDEKSGLPLLVDDVRLTDADLKPSIFNLGISGFDGHTRAFLKIQDGCDLNCSFCIIPHVRGGNVSRPIDEAVDEARRLAANGYKEIVLTGIHVGSFGRIPELVRRMLGIPGLARIRLSSIEANEVSDELIAAMDESGGRFCPHFHLPLQSGDEGVLRAMRRRYNPDRFMRTLDLDPDRIELPGLTTDIIVGFPTETDDAFENTLELCRRAEFSRVHIFPYSPRRGTDAAGMRDLPDAIKTERIVKLESLAAELTERYARRFIGRAVDVLVEGTGHGYTERYLKATFPAGRRNDLRTVTVLAFENGGLRCA